MRVNRAQLILILSSGIFLGFVLFIYKAFGIDQGVSFSGHSLFERALLFSITTSVVYGVNELFLRKKIKLEKSTGWVLWILWELFSAGSCVFLLFDYFWNFTESHHSYFLLLGEFSSVMLIPHAIYFIVKSKNRGSQKLMLFVSESGKEKVSIPTRKFMYAKAEDNYVNLIFKVGEEVQSRLIRKKLTDLEREFTGLLRVHRSYLVNPSAIQHMEQSPKSNQVYFEGGHKVPVSNSYLEQLKELTSHPK